MKRLLTCALLLLAGLSLAFPVTAQTVVAGNHLSCAGTRAGSALGCTAGEFVTTVNISSASGGPTSCVYGDYLTLVGSTNITGTNADRYNVGFFAGENGNDPRLSSSADQCSVATFPTNYSPWFAKNGDACGDYPANAVSSPTIQNLQVLCQPDASGNLAVPYTIVYSQSAYACTGPTDVAAGNSSKCNAGTASVSGISVYGSLTVTKKTVPSGDSQSFAFTASGTSALMPGDSSFSLTDNGSYRVRMALSSSGSRTLTITELANTFWEPTATITCTKPDGSSSSAFVSTDGAVRTITATLNVTNPNARCTITNTKRTVSATNSTVLANPTSVVNDGLSTSTITVTLKDTGNNLVAGKVVTLSAGSGSSTTTTLSGTTDANGQATFSVKDSVAESVTYTARDVTDNITITQTATVTFSSISSFNAFETSTAAGKTSGQIYTKLAGTAFDLALVAIAGSGQATGFGGNVRVELLANTGTAGSGYDATSRCPTVGTIIQTLNSFTISGGRSTVSFSAVAGAYRDVRVRISYPTSSPTITVCSGDSFAIRPQQFTLSTTTVLNPIAPATDKLAAGEDFTLQADPGVTVGYTGTPAVDTAKVVDHVTPTANAVNAALAWNNPTMPLPGAAAAAGFPQASGGSVSNVFRYQDVGTITFNADAVTDAAYTAVDQSGDCVAGSTANTADSSGRFGCMIGSSAFGPLGRFYPHHFAVNASFTPGCAAGGFTYMDHDALITVLNVTAQSKSDATATRYVSSPASTYVPLATLGIELINGSSATDLLSRLSQPTVPARSWTTGVYTADDTYRFDARNAAAPVVDGPDDALKARVTISDTDGVQITKLNDAAVLPAVSRVDSPSTKVRFGRLWLGNAYGSDKLNLAMPYELQYWNGNAFVKNAADTCSTVATNNLGLGNYQGDITATNMGIAKFSAGANSGGGGTIIITAPSPAAAGSVDIVFNLGSSGSPTNCTSPAVAGGTAAALSHLSGKWCGSTGYNRDPSARATFGVFGSILRKGPIYIRENF